MAQQTTCRISGGLRYTVHTTYCIVPHQHGYSVQYHDKSISKIFKVGVCNMLPPSVQPAKRFRFTSFLALEVVIDHNLNLTLVYGIMKTTKRSHPLM